MMRADHPILAIWLGGLVSVGACALGKVEHEPAEVPDALAGNAEGNGQGLRLSVDPVADYGPAAPDFAGYALSPDPDPSLPLDGALDILLVGDAELRMPLIANTLEQALLARPEYSAVSVDTLETTGFLLDFYFAWTERDSRLAALDGGYDYIVFADSFNSTYLAPEAHFAGVLELANATRALGATPILLMTEVASPPPNDDGEMCSNTCPFLGHGCNDGGADAVGMAHCDLGTDCNSCGIRTRADRVGISREEHFWRTAIGTGCVPVPSSVVLAKLGIGIDSQRPPMMAAALYTALSEESINAWDGWDTTGEWPSRADEVLAQYESDQGTTHYLGPHLGSVRIEGLEPGTANGYMISGNSSEKDYSHAMRGLLEREGYLQNLMSIGSCRLDKLFDEACMARAAAAMQQDDYVSLYARMYWVSRAEIQQAGNSSLLSPQVYDRQWDHVSGTDGAQALDDITDRMINTSINSRYYDASWLPLHINFAKYKAETGANLLRDSVNASDEVQAGQAAMSYVSRTGLSPRLSGVSENTATAIALGEHTIRTLAAYSRTGLHIPDLPGNRVSIH